jgi:predicted ATPase
MFPDLFEDIEFVNAAHQMTARFIRPGRQDAVPVHLAPKGWLVGLLHLCALASTEPGGVVAIDEPENALHPYAIRRLMDALAAWSEPRKITVILATHSPVILNQFDQSPERLFVMQPGEAVLPVALDALRDPAWLRSFAIGDLYAHDEFGAPLVP